MGFASRLAAAFSRDSYKMAFCVRTDIGMKKGKIAAQCGHAAIGGYKAGLKLDPGAVEVWDATGSAKIVLRIGSVEELRQLQAKANYAGLPTCTVRDAGRTQVDGGTLTVLAIGPGTEEAVSAVTGHLKLL